MPTLSDSIIQHPVILVIGPAGCGKTTFCLQFRKPYLINVDNNLGGPKNFFKRSGRDMSGIKYDNVAWDDSGNPIPIKDQYVRFHTLLTRGVADKDSETIIIDSTTSMQSVLEAFCVTKRGKPVGTKFTFDEWYDFQYIWSETINKLRQCGKAVMIIGHEQVEKGEIDQVLRYVLAIPGKTGDLMPMLVTDVWRMSTELKLVGTAQKAVYNVTTVQTSRNPNIKTSFTLPSTFEATQDNINLIEKQIYGE